MGLFGKDFKKAWAESKHSLDAQLRDVLNLPPVPDLAADIMSAFGVNGPKRGQPLTQRDIVKWMVAKHEFSSRAHRILAADKLNDPVREALQVLEHAELLYVTVESDAADTWRLTSKGKNARAGGKAVIQQCISERSTGSAPGAAHRLQELQRMLADGLVSEDEYSAKRQRIIDEL